MSKPALHWEHTLNAVHLVIGGQHDGHLPFWLPGFVKLIMLLLHVLFAFWNKYTTTTTTTTCYSLIAPPYSLLAATATTTTTTTSTSTTTTTTTTATATTVVTLYNSLASQDWSGGVTCRKEAFLAVAQQYQSVVDRDSRKFGDCLARLRVRWCLRENGKKCLHCVLFLSVVHCLQYLYKYYAVQHYGI